jgi:hypothetical protein
MVLNVVSACHDTNLNSKPKYSLLTLHSKGEVNLPKCHLAIEILPVMINSDVLNNIPTENLFVVEVLLMNDSFLEYKEHLRTFLTWAQQRNAPILFTVPTSYSNDLLHIVEIELEIVKRPFQLETCTYTTT